jgi:hypothetical protein
MIRSAALVLSILAIAWPLTHAQAHGATFLREETIMDSSDSGSAQARGPRSRRPPLPEIISLAVERVRVEPRSYKFVRSVQEDAAEALAFTVELKGELRLDVDATPVLYVGDVELSQGESLGGARYRFLAFAAEQKSLRADAPISLGWPGHKPHVQTRFRYEPERR